MFQHQLNITRYAWTAMGVIKNISCSMHKKIINNETLKLKPLVVKSLSKKRNTTNNSSIKSSIRKRRDIEPRSRSEGMQLQEDEHDSLDDLSYIIGKYSSKASALHAEHENARDLIRKVRYIRMKTLENKYFKKSSNPNLLSWSAKQQLRFLHHKDPKTWSVPQLKESFPVSEENIKMILKDRRRLHRPEDILVHDQTVQNNWIHLKASLEGKEVPSFDETVYKSLTNMHHESLIENADGIKHLPIPVPKTSSFKPRGPFSMIVSDCYKLKELANKAVAEKNESSLGEKCESLSELLCRASQIWQEKANASKDAEIKDSKESQLMEQFERNKEYSWSNENQYSQEKSCIEENAFKKYKEHQLNRGIQSQIQLMKARGLANDKADLFVSGNCIYDSNGKFLYRIP